VKQILAYGGLLAVGTLTLQWLDYQRLARTHTADIYIFLIAAGFLVLGVVLGVRVFAQPVRAPFDGNPEAQAVLGISPRELAVLEEVAAGRSNKRSRCASTSPPTPSRHTSRDCSRNSARAAAPTRSPAPASSACCRDGLFRVRGAKSPFRAIAGSRVLRSAGGANYWED
jgi:hypothetical protein